RARGGAGLPAAARGGAVRAGAVALDRGGRVRRGGGEQAGGAAAGDRDGPARGRCGLGAGAPGLGGRLPAAGDPLASRATARGGALEGQGGGHDTCARPTVGRKKQGRPPRPTGPKPPASTGPPPVATGPALMPPIGTTAPNTVVSADSAIVRAGPVSSGGIMPAMTSVTEPIAAEPPRPVLMFSHSTCMPVVSAVYSAPAEAAPAESIPAESMP